MTCRVIGLERNTDGDKELDGAVCVCVCVCVSERE